MDGNPKLITVTCPKHHKVLTDGVWQHLSEKRKVDLSISCHQRRIEAHQMILELFVPSLVNHTSSSADERCEMNDVDFGHAAQQIGDLETIVEFAYRGQVSFTRDRLEPLLKTAKKLDVQLLIDAIERLVKESPDILNGDTQLEKESPLDETVTCDNHDNRRKRNGISAKLEKKFPANTVDATLAVVQQEVSTITTKNRRGRPRKIEQPWKPRIVRRGGRQQRPISIEEKSYSCSKKAAEQEILQNELVKLDEQNLSEQNELDDSESSSSVASESNWTPTTSKESRLPRKATLGIIGSVKRGGRGRVTGKSRILARERESKLDDQTGHSRTEYKKLWRKNRPVLKCPHCPYETRDKLRYKVHQSKHDPTVVIFKCEVCSATFQAKDSLDRHELTHEGTQEIYQCPQCPYSSPKKINYHRHITAIHKIAADGQRLEEKYKCAECDFMCMYKSQFTLHVRMRHSSDKPFKCPHLECTYCSIRKGDLEKHINTVHLHVRAYMCEICGHKSTHQGALNRHRVSHTGVKLFKCTYDFCEKRYGHADQLKNHLLRHVAPDEKPYVCHLCGHGCRRRDNLQMHLRRIHRTTLNNEALQ